MEEGQQPPAAASPRAKKIDYIYPKIRSERCRIQRVKTRVGRQWVVLVEDQRRIEKDLREEKRRIRGLPSPAMIRAVRLKVGQQLGPKEGLSQRQISKILGGGVRSFQKYEAGTVPPGIAMANLLRLLDRYPGEIHYLIDIEEHPAPKPAKIKKIRKGLRLSSRQASKILGGGERSFERYESGRAPPCRAMARLLWVLDDCPELLEHLR